MLALGVAASCAALAPPALAEDRVIEFLSGSGAATSADLTGASSDGSRVFFRTTENIPGSGDTDGLQDIYQAQGGAITLLTGNNPAVSGGAIASFSGASSDGTRVFFFTAENVPGSGDTDGLDDVYQAQGGVITLLSGNNPAGSGGSGAFFARASSDGTRVFFNTTENIPSSGDTDLLRDIYQAQGGAITLLSGNNAAGTGGIAADFSGASSDGARVFFRTAENIPSSGDTDLLQDIHQAQGGAITLLTGNNPAVSGGLAASFSGASSDGSRVFFVTTEDIPGSGDTDALQDVYQAQGGATTLLSGNNSAGTGGDVAYFERASSDGSRVFFDTDENIPGSGDFDGLADIHQAQGGVITVLTGNNSAGSGGLVAYFAGASSDGSRVFFETGENVPGSGDTDGLDDVYQAQDGVITLLSGNNPAGSGGSAVGSAGASSDGTRVYFGTIENVPGSGDTDALGDIYQAQAGAITLLSGNNPLGSGGASASSTGFSQDGSRAFFVTNENVPGSGDTDGAQDIYQSRVLPPPPGPGAAPQPTGQRAAALKKCKKKKRKARARCRKKAKKLPV